MEKTWSQHWDTVCTSVALLAIGYLLHWLMVRM